jgi:hypothetical protein
VTKGCKDLEKLVKTATSVFYNQDQKREKKKGLASRGSDRSSILRGSFGAQSKPVDRRVTLRGSAPGGSHLQDLAPFAREIIGRHTAFGSQGN